MYQVEAGGIGGAQVRMILGVAVQYLATRVALVAVERVRGWSAGWRAVAQWLPIASTAVAAVCLKQTDIALGLAFGSTVAALSLVAGMASYVTPIHEFPAERKNWGLVLPAAIFLLLAGFRGNLSWVHALMLLAMGSAFLPVWIGRETRRAEPVSADAPAPNWTGRLDVWVVATLLLAALGAWATASGAAHTSARSPRLSAELLSATVISPLLLLPSLGGATMLAQARQTGRAVTALVGTALLNVCLLVPLIVLVHGASGFFTHVTNADGAVTTAGWLPTTYGMVTWRVDAVVLVILGFTLAPVAAERWLPGRLESVALVLLYAAYLVAETLISARIVM